MVRGATNTADQGGCAHGALRAGDPNELAEIQAGRDYAARRGAVRLASPGRSRHPPRERLRPTCGRNGNAEDEVMDAAKRAAGAKRTRREGLLVTNAPVQL